MRLSILGIVALLLSCALAHSVVSNEADARSMYAEFKRKYNKAITNKDDNLRFTIFRKNLERIDQMQKNEQGTAQYGVTKFADLTAEEFAATYTNTEFKKPDSTLVLTNDVLPDPPEEFDWRSEGVVGPAPDQGSCGAGWAFATIGNIESLWAMKNNKSVSLSEQQLLDCDRWSSKCHGGNPAVAIDEIIRMGGLMKDTAYPYTGRPNRCKFAKKKVVVQVKNSIALPQDEGYQTAYLAKYGPLIAAFNGECLQFYHTGVMNQNWKCDPGNLNHAGLTVGYGTEEDLDYWIVRNSWGKQWGEGGYFRITRGEGICGIDRSVSSAIV